MTKEEVRELQQIAQRLRLSIVKSVAAAGSGHPGGSLSIADILATLYFKEMRIDPKNPAWPDRDRFVLSKGHAAPALYAVLAEAGFIDKEELMTLRQLGSRLQGHPSMRHVPGVEISTGSLGQGLSAANGMAIAAKLDNRPTRVYAIIGDGESQEGQIWEASMTSVHYKLDNLMVFLDYNGLQIDGRVHDVKSFRDPGAKWQAFGWHVLEIDGHDIEAIYSACQEAKATKGKPTMVVAHTVKGKGVPFMENIADWHGKAPSKEQAEEAIRYLEASLV
ncbi:MAG: transketolase [Bacillota bacterium]|nr:transketolase [Bacillota bacterium]MDI9415284.1 transketolase [Bacillota bacterium]NLD11952.1 transketolase [Bacillota bacterium]HAV20976.1 transketolase [Bacillota bacterium]HOB87946.1 transketolase [Bacillota bacterium]